MGKASNRRKKRRQGYFRHLAETDPEMFSWEWSKRLESWSRAIHQNAGGLVDNQGRSVPAAFETVSHALEELSAIGQNAVALEGEATQTVLTSECCTAMAQAIDPRLYRLSNIRSNCQKAKSGYQSSR